MSRMPGGSPGNSLGYASEKIIGCQELPPRLLALVRKLETADATEDSQRA